MAGEGRARCGSPIKAPGTVKHAASARYGHAGAVASPLRSCGWKWVQVPLHLRCVHRHSAHR